MYNIHNGIPNYSVQYYIIILHTIIIFKNNKNNTQGKMNKTRHI